MLWGEVTKWAKSHGYKITKKDDKFFWICLETEKNGEENSLDGVVKKVYNEITDYKYKEHQDKYE